MTPQTYPVTQTTCNNIMHLDFVTVPNQPANIALLLQPYANDGYKVNRINYKLDKGTLKVRMIKN